MKQGNIGHSFCGTLLILILPLIVSACASQESEATDTQKNCLITGVSLDDFVKLYLPYSRQRYYYIGGPLNTKVADLRTFHVLVFKSLDLSTSPIPDFYLNNDLDNLGITKKEGVQYVTIDAYKFNFTDLAGQVISISLSPMRRENSYGPQDNIWPPEEFFKTDIEAKQTKLPGGGTEYRSFGLLQPNTF